MLPTPAHRALIEAAAAFVENEITPHAGSWERTGGGIPDSVLARIGQLGYYAMLVPQHLGGGGLDMVSYALVTEQFAAADCGLCNLIIVTNSPVATAIRDHGTASQIERFLEPMARGEQRGCFMLSEAAAGSDAAAITTRAEVTTKGYRLDGTKNFVTAGHSADFALVVAVTDATAGKRGISTFLVPRASYRVSRLEEKLGHRNCDTAEVVFEAVTIGQDLRLGAEGDGYRIALAYLQGGRIGVAAQGVGVARAALEAATRYAGERQSFGQTIINHQAVGFRLAQMATKVTAARQLTLHAAARVDAGEEAIAEASMAKAYATAIAEEVTSDAIQIHGGYGYLSDYPVERFYRDARVLSIYEGTNDIQHLVIARAIASGWSPRA